MKPKDYGLTTTELDNVAQRNLALLATIFIYLVRKVSWEGKHLDMPQEIGKYLYSDEDMKHVYAKIKSTLDYCEVSSSVIYSVSTLIAQPILWLEFSLCRLLQKA
jgi:hypothetical protein